MPIVLTMVVMLGLAAAPAMAAPAMGEEKAPTGERISITSGCWDDCGAPQTFAAATPFHVQHGYVVSIPDGENPALGKYEFALDLDGTRLGATYKQTVSDKGGHFRLFWVFNFPAGFTGVHTLTGHWYAPCGDVNVPCNGLARNTVIESFTVAVPVTFE